MRSVLNKRLNTLKLCILFLMLAVNTNSSAQLIDSTANVLEADLTGQVMRCNDTIQYWLNVSNTGTAITSGVYFLELDDEFTFIESSHVPDSILLNTIYWHIDSLFFFESEGISVELSTPSVFSLGDTMTSSLCVLSLDSLGAIVHTSCDTLNQKMICAYDPNIKSVEPIGIDSIGIISMSTQSLEYLVNFQNTGNDTAFTVVIKDQLDVNLDWSSLNPIASSHSMITLVDQNGLVSFTFTNILLPDSTTNQLGSQGFVKYSLDLIDNLSIGTEIKNTAEIYFDFNPPIVTNTTLNTLFDCNTILDSIDLNTTVLCNGDSLLGTLSDSISGFIYLWEFNDSDSLYGQEISWWPTNVGNQNLNISVTNEFCSEEVDLTIFVSNSFNTVRSDTLYICSGDSYSIGSSNYSSTGIYTDVLTSILTGCDSTIITNLTVLNAIITNQTINICTGETYSIGTSSYTSTGNYVDTLNSILTGCDSTVHTLLTAIPQTIVDQTINICSGETYIIGTSNYSVTGNYIDTLTSILTACDSIVNTNLTILTLNELSQMITICFGDSYAIGTSSYSTSGSFTDTLIAANGCDSTVHTLLTVIPQTIVNQTINICAGETYSIGTSNYTSTGNYVDILISVLTGCDSTVNTSLNVIEPLIDNQDITICFGQNHNVGTSIYNTSGNFIDTLISINTGCDSIVNTNLTVLDLNEFDQTITICFGDSYAIGTSSYSTSGSFTDILIATNGCDSTVHTLLTVIPQTIVDQTINICSGETYIIGTSNYSVSGNYTDTLTSILTACDSIVHTNLTLLTLNELSQTVTICFGDPYVIGTSSYSTSGSFTDVLIATNGCDSIVNTILTVIPENVVNQTASICDGDNFIVGTSVYTVSGNYTDVLVSVTGCDSIINTEVMVTADFVISQNITICYGESFSIGNSTYTTPGHYTDTLAMFVLGCDSIVHTNLTINLPIDLSLDIDNNTIKSNQNNSYYQWVDCNDSYSFITNTISNEREIEIVEAGNYAVIINNNNCIDTSACVYVDFVSLSEYVSTNLIKIYPNPSQGKFTISSPGTKEFIVRLTNSIGELVYVNNEPSMNKIIDISQLPKGIYFVRIKFENSVITKKIVLN